METILTKFKILQSNPAALVDFLASITNKEMKLLYKIAKNKYCDGEKRTIEDMEEEIGFKYQSIMYHLNNKKSANSMPNDMKLKIIELLV